METLPINKRQLRHKWNISMLAIPKILTCMGTALKELMLVATERELNTSLATERESQKVDISKSITTLTHHHLVHHRRKG